MTAPAVRVTFTNPNPATIYNRLAARIGRQPTDAETRAELDRILGRKPRP